MRIAVLAVVVATTTGCDLRGSEEPSLDDSLLTRSAEVDQGEMAGIVRGTLQLDAARGCILLSGRPVVWPAGTTLTKDPPTLHLPRGLSARSGDTVIGGGGEVSSASIQDTLLLIEGDLDAARGCGPADTEVAVFDSRGRGMSVS